MIAIFIFAGLAIGWIFFRNSTHKIMLSIALASVSGGAFRLYQMIVNGEPVTLPLIAVAVLGLIWLGAWLSNRAATQKPAPSLASKTRSGPPRVR